MANGAVVFGHGKTSGEEARYVYWTAYLGSVWLDLVSTLVENVF